MGAICPPIRRALIGASSFLLLRGSLQENNIQKDHHLRPPRLRRRTVTESQASSGEHSLPRVGLLGAICPPIRRALIGAGGFLRLRGSLQENNIQKDHHLRPLRLRRRTVTENQPSSGQHSLPGVGLLGAICPPIRRALIGAGGFLRLRGSLPEENIQNEDHLRPLRLRRRTVPESQANSGQHSLPGVGLTVAGLSSDEPPAHRSWRPDASLLPRIKSRSLMSIVSSGIGFLF